MKPTVGRILLYQSYGSPGGEYLPEERPALITKVYSDSEVHVTVFTPNGSFSNKCLIATEPTPGFVSWPKRD